MFHAGSSSRFLWFEAMPGEFPFVLEHRVGVPVGMGDLPALHPWTVDGRVIVCLR